MGVDYRPVIPDPTPTPDRGNYTDLTPFRFWAQKVLPLVYDESLSYYEVLCKVVDYLNKTMEDVGVLNDDISSLYQAFTDLTDWTDDQINALLDAYTSLQNYVNNYFDNLNVQTEINNKLDAMATNGTLSALIYPFVHEELPDIVTTWLAAHITEPEGVVIDSSLTISGAAADAKAAGDAISDLKGAIKTKIGGSGILVNATNVSDYSNVNTYPLNSLVLVTKNIATQISNVPYTDKSFYILSSGYSTSPSVAPQYGGEIQIAIPFETNEKQILYRSYNGSSWSNWTSGTENLAYYLRASGIFINSQALAETYDDVNNFPLNQIILVGKNYLNDIANVPYTDTSFSIICTGFAKTTNAPFGGETQIAIPFDSNKPIATRSYNGSSWSNWKYNGECEFNADNTNFIEIIDKAILTNNSVVYLTSGTYNFFDTTHDETYWKNKRPSTRYCGLILKNGIKLIGKGNVIFNAEYSGSDEDIKENFSIFNIAGDFQLKNVKAVGENICYIVHDDQGIVSSDPSIGEYDNVTMIHEGSDHTFTYGAPICIGGGSTANINRTIKNCVFDSTRNNTVNYHTGNSHHGNIIAESNYFINGTIRFNKYVGGTIKAITTNNSITENVIVTDDTAITCYNWNNEIRNS